MLPSKVKDEKEIENEGLFTCKEPEDANSHGLVLRDTTASERKSKDEASESNGKEDDSDDAEDGDNIEINLNAESKSADPPLKSRAKSKKHDL